MKVCLIIHIDRRRKGFACNLNRIKAEGGASVARRSTHRRPPSIILQNIQVISQKTREMGTLLNELQDEGESK